VLCIELATILIVSVNLWHSIPRNIYFFIVGITQLVGWTTQFAGHGVWEGRRPALVDNAFQVFIAPLFVMVEAFFYFGFRKELKKEVDAKLKLRNDSKKKLH
jgi:uncharacterized membrane protein YGL010W